MTISLKSRDDTDISVSSSANSVFTEEGIAQSQRYEINKLTMQFVDKIANVEFYNYLLVQDVNRFPLAFVLTINMLAGPALLYSNSLIGPRPLSGLYRRLGKWFMYTISQINVLLFVMFCMGQMGLRWIQLENTQAVQRLRMGLIATYVLLVSCCTGLEMMIKIRHLCSPEQLRIREMHICSTSPAGAIPVDCFCVGSALVTFLQFAFPTPWSVIVVAWLLQLAALLQSAYEFTTPQTTIYNTILVTFHVLAIGLHGVIHWNTMQAFVREQLDAAAEAAKSLAMGAEETITEHLAKVYLWQQAGQRGGFMAACGGGGGGGGGGGDATVGDATDTDGDDDDDDGSMSFRCSMSSVSDGLLLISDQHPDPDPDAVFDAVSDSDAGAADGPRVNFRDLNSAQLDVLKIFCNISVDLVADPSSGARRVKPHHLQLLKTFLGNTSFLSAFASPAAAALSPVVEQEGEPVPPNPH